MNMVNVHLSSHDVHPTPQWTSPCETSLFPLIIIDFYSPRVPYTFFSWRVNRRFCFSVKREWGFIFSVLRESIFFCPRGTGFRLFRDPWNMHLLTRDLWINDFCGNNFSLFWRFHLASFLRLSITCGLLKFKAQPTMHFSLPSIKCSAAPPSFRLLQHSSDKETVFGSSWKLGGAAEHLIDGCEIRICRLNFEF